METIRFSWYPIPMFIRQSRTRRVSNGKIYTKYVLVESVRTEKGPRQRTIMHLGSFDLPKERWKELAACLERKLSGQSTFQEEAPDIEHIATQIMEQYGRFERRREEKRSRQEQQEIVGVSTPIGNVRKHRSKSDVCFVIISEPLRYYYVVSFPINPTSFFSFRR